MTVTKHGVAEVISDRYFRLNILVNYFGQGWSALMAIAFVPLYIRILGLEAYGLVGVLMFMQTWFTLFDFGMTPTINREMARFTAGTRSVQDTLNLLRTVEYIVFGVALVIGVAVWVSSDWIANDWLKSHGLSNFEVANAISLIGCVVALRFVEGMYRGAIFGLQKHVWLNIATAIFSTLRWGGAALMLTLFKPSLSLFFGWQAMVSALTVALFAWKIKEEFPLGEEPAKFSRKEISGLWRFASGSMLATCLAVLQTQVDKLMLSKMSPLETFGYYTAAWTVAAGLYQLITPVTQVFFPKFSALFAKQQETEFELRNAYHQAAQFLTWVMVPPAFMLMFFGGSILHIWTRDAALTTAATPLIALFALGIMLNGFQYVPHVFALSSGWTRFGVMVNGCSLLLFSPILILSIYHYGAIGAAAVWVLLNCSSFLVGMQFFYRKLLVLDKWRWYIEDVALPVMGVLVVCLTFKWFHDDFFSLWGLAITYIVNVLVITLAVPRARVVFMDFLFFSRENA